MKKITLTLTEEEFFAVLDVTDTISAMIGSYEDFTVEQNKNIKLIDRMLKNNGFKRKYK